jgi:predicted transposase
LEKPAFEFILRIKLLPAIDQSKPLIRIIFQANAACCSISEIAWDKRIFNQFKLHHETYNGIKASYDLSAQMIVRCISKVTDAYKADRKTKRQFRPMAAIIFFKQIVFAQQKIMVCMPQYFLKVAGRVGVKEADIILCLLCGCLSRQLRAVCLAGG